MSSLNLDISSFNNSNDIDNYTINNSHIITENKEYSYKELEELKNKINTLDDSHHNFILKIICDCNIEFSENSNGCFINLLNVPNNVLVKIEQYVNFLIEKEENLKEFEILKKSIQTNID